MTKWVRESKENFDWTVQYCFALCKEYTFRYGRTHAGERIANWYNDNLPQLPQLGFTEPPRCFSTFADKIPVTPSVYEDYRQYYRIAKSHLFVWKNRPAPSWL